MLERLSTLWADSAIQNLYSIDGEASRRGAIQSFWSGYLSAPQVYNNVKRMLRERYGEMLPSWEGENDHKLDEELQNRLAEHIVIGWMRGLEGFGIEGLAGRLAHSASDSVLAHAAWYIGKQVEAVKEARPAACCARVDGCSSWSMCERGNSMAAPGIALYDASHRRFKPCASIST